MKKKKEAQLATCLPFWPPEEWFTYMTSAQKKAAELTRPAGVLAEIVALSEKQWRQYLKWKASFFGFSFPKTTEIKAKGQDPIEGIDAAFCPASLRGKHNVPVGNMATWEAFLTGWSYATIGRDLDWQECPALKKFVYGLKRAED